MDGTIILETKRTYLRQIYLEDFEEIAAILGDCEIMYAWEHAFTDEEIYNWIRENIVRYTRDGYSYWAVVLKDTGRIIGVMGILKELVDDEIYTGIGYIFHKAFWHQGFALECAEACKNYAFHVFQLSLLTAQIRPENTSSIKLAEKLGISVIKRFKRIYREKTMPHIYMDVSNSCCFG